MGFLECGEWGIEEVISMGAFLRWLVALVYVILVLSLLFAGLVVAVRLVIQKRGRGLSDLLAHPIALTKALLGCTRVNPAKIRELAGMVKRRWDETKRQADQCHTFMQVLDRLPHLVQWEAGRPKGLNVGTELDIAGDYSQAARVGVFRELRCGLKTCGSYMRLAPHPNLLMASALFARCWQICQAQENCSHEQECPLLKFANSVDFQV